MIRPSASSPSRPCSSILTGTTPTRYLSSLRMKSPTWLLGSRASTILYFLRGEDLRGAASGFICFKAALQLCEKWRRGIQRARRIHPGLRHSAAVDAGSWTSFQQTKTITKDELHQAARLFLFKFRSKKAVKAATLHLHVLKTIRTMLLTLTRIVAW